jgi:hypothetical protein
MIRRQRPTRHPGNFLAADQRALLLVVRIAYHGHW